MDEQPNIDEQNWSPCSCGGTYRLGYEFGMPVLHHSLPTCSAYEAADDTLAAVRFSEQQRDWLMGKTRKELR